MIRRDCPERSQHDQFGNIDKDTADFMKRYWQEGAYYEFTYEQFEQHIFPAAAEIQRLYESILPKLLGDDAFLDRLMIPPHLRDYVRNSYYKNNTATIGRLDLAYDGINPPRLLEYNADTPAIIYETGFYQGKWLDDMIESGQLPETYSQFNTLQDDLIAALAAKKTLLNPLHIACYQKAPEDRMTVSYIENCAKYAGITTSIVEYEDIATSSDGGLYDNNGNVISSVYKFYPWEWILSEKKYSSMLANCKALFMEPAWKLMFANKMTLVKLWEKFEGHSNLLPAYSEEDPNADRIWDDCVLKPVYSREGENIQLISNGEVIDSRDGPYEDSGFIVQKRYHLPKFGSKYAIITVWIIDGRPSAMGVLEQEGSSIIDNHSRYVPHVII